MYQVSYVKLRPMKITRYGRTNTGKVVSTKSCVLEGIKLYSGGYFAFDYDGDYLCVVPDEDFRLGRVVDFDPDQGMVAWYSSFSALFWHDDNGVKNVHTVIVTGKTGGSAYWCNVDFEFDPEVNVFVMIRRGDRAIIRTARKTARSNVDPGRFVARVYYDAGVDEVWQKIQKHV